MKHVIVALLGFAVPVLPSGQEPAGGVRPLILGVAMDRTISGFDTHAYQITSRPNDFVQLEVMQKGIDLVVSVYGADGKKLLEVDSPNGTDGPETVRFIAEAGGQYVVRVTCLEADAPPGGYVVTLQTARTATAAERASIVADVLNQSPLGRMRVSIERITRSIQAKWGIYLKSLETGEEIALNADEAMETMSVIKIPIMAEVFRQAETGRFSLTDRVTLSGSDTRGGTGILRTFDPGASLTLKDLVTLMIIVSDNTATDRLIERIGGTAPVNALMRRHGLETITAQSTMANWFAAFSRATDPWRFHLDGKNPLGLSSARDMGRLLEMMYRGELVSQDASRQMLQVMRNQLFSSRLPRYLSGGFRMPHKTGDFLPYIGNDVGIIETATSHIVISVFTAHHNGDPAMLEDAIGRIAAVVSAYFAAR